MLYLSEEKSSSKNWQKVQLILIRCYYLLLYALLVISTVLMWPIILLLQRYSVTREWYYSQIFSVIYKVFMNVLIAPKRKLFHSMNKYFEELPRPIGGNVIRVLEIGPGTGDNFKYYKSAIQLTTVDLNPLLKEIAEKLSAEYPLVDIVDSQVANAEKMTCFEDDSFDIVCGTMIMCCINDNEAALSEIHRVLKPNGRYYYMEGNRMQPNRFFLFRFLESVFAKFWIICEYGCKCIDNNFEERLGSSKLVLDWRKIYRIPECPVGHEVHYGCALKI